MEQEQITKDLVMYILVNKDITISPGKLAGQVGHAVETYMNQLADKSIVEEHMKNSQKKIVLRCSQKKLEELEKEGYVSIRDNGLTELPPKTLTCVNLGIIDRTTETPKFVKRLRLY